MKAELESASQVCQLNADTNSLMDRPSEFWITVQERKFSGNGSSWDKAGRKNVYVELSS